MPVSDQGSQSAGNFLATLVALCFTYPCQQRKDWAHIFPRSKDPSCSCNKLGLECVMIPLAPVITIEVFTIPPTRRILLICDSIKNTKNELAICQFLLGNDELMCLPTGDGKYFSFFGFVPFCIFETILPFSITSLKQCFS